MSSFTNSFAMSLRPHLLNTIRRPSPFLFLRSPRPSLHQRLTPSQQHYTSSSRKLSPRQAPKERPRFRQSIPSGSLPSEPAPPPPNPPPPQPRRFRLPITTLLLGTCIFTFSYHSYILTQAQRGSTPALHALATYERNMVLSPTNLRDGRWYTLLTSTLSHGSPVHLACNMIALWSFGPLAVARLGAGGFAALWVGAGVCGGLAQAWGWGWKRKSATLLVDERGGAVVQARAVGASGALCGVISALACVMPGAQLGLFFVPMSFAMSVLVETGLSVACIRNDWLPGVGHTAHLGGTAFGVLFGVLALRRGDVRGIWRDYKLWRGVGYY